ncbi:MAG: hypothetical protein KGQ59_02145 [Bdellovibrionales bacterium]|nr:hypothetical protein [Bdellovibrionales bacterium]
MVQLSVLHWPKALLIPGHSSPGFPLEDALRFETCQRILWIQSQRSSPDLPLPPEASYFTENEAYGFLLEVICGLHSRVFGETEVLGQFKLFYKTRPELSPWGQWLIEDAKTIRSRHLRDIGSHSYGSMVRRWCGSLPHVVILGTGQLAEKIRPWIPHAQVLPSRNCEALPLADAVIVAAPMEDADLVRLRKKELWIDLRAERGEFRADRTLEDLFAELEQDSKRHRNALPSIRKDILELTQARFNRQWCRPMGWEDLT